MSPSFSPRPMLFLVAALILLKVVDGQNIGTDLCACSPSIITFRLGFDLLCPGDVTGEGIEDQTCGVRNQESDLNDNFTPQLISSIEIAELNQDILPFTSTVFSGNRLNGDEFTYTSVVATDSDLAPVNITKGIQMTLRAISTDGCTNNEGCGIANIWGILFTNECGVFPVLDIGEAIGWTEIVHFTNPINQYCPGNPTFAPTTTPVTPTFNPTLSPTFNPMFDPTSDPTVNPTSDPTVNPTSSPTEMPTKSPTFNPTSSPTKAPLLGTTSPVTDAPSSKPDTPSLKPSFETFEPSAQPSDSYPPIGGATKSPGKGGKKGSYYYGKKGSNYGKGKGGKKGSYYGKGKGGKKGSYYGKGKGGKKGSYYGKKGSYYGKKGSYT